MGRLFATFATVFLLMACSAAMAEEFEISDVTTLLCEARVQGQLLTANLIVDYGRKKVNGMPASFTDTMIEWSVNDNYEVAYNQLNRLSGTYNAWIEGEVYPSPPPTYNCAIAGDPKF